MYASNLLSGQGGARFYSTSVQQLVASLPVQYYNWAKQSVCAESIDENDVKIYKNCRGCVDITCTLPDTAMR